MLAGSSGGSGSGSGSASSIASATSSGAARLTTRRLQEGDRVILTTAYRSYSDAGDGPLHPGDVGTVEKDDGSTSQPFQVRVDKGGTFWYEAAALQSAGGGAGAALATPLPGIAAAAQVADGGVRMMKGWRNWWSDPSSCSCYDAATGVVVATAVPRLHPADDWRWPVLKQSTTHPHRECACEH